MPQIHVRRILHATKKQYYCPSSAVRLHHFGVNLRLRIMTTWTLVLPEDTDVAVKRLVHVINNYTEYIYIYKYIF